jgi:hypothetical protein
MRRGTPKALHENVVKVHGGAGDWKLRLGFREADDAYLLLLDRSGRVVWRHAGPFRNRPPRGRDAAATHALSACEPAPPSLHYFIGRGGSRYFARKR